MNVYLCLMAPVETTPIREHIIDLDLTPHERWQFLSGYITDMDELLSCYLRDFEGAESMLLAGMIEYKKNILPAHYLEEIACVASFSRFSEDQVLLANLYYDILKLYFGCTAFAVNTGETTFHCRNLDWHTENNVLSRHSMIFDFRHDGETLFKTVGWPGFIGALSGTKPGKFSLTLNAVLSQDPPEVAFPISFLLRDVLTSADSYADARTMLEQTPIVSDCLILLSGIGAQEHIVIERTPRRAAVRETGEQFIAVTNDYKKLQNGTGGNILQATSCSRYDRALTLLREAIPQNNEACLNILQDEDVAMQITVQQMVFNNKTGEISLLRT
jgi:acid ceramidase